jgi:hypothetical protein
MRKADLLNDDSFVEFLDVEDAGFGKWILLFLVTGWGIFLKLFGLYPYRSHPLQVQYSKLHPKAFPSVKSNPTSHHPAKHNFQSHHNLQNSSGKTLSS